jgi:hypothetical protein
MVRCRNTAVRWFCSASLLVDRPSGYAVSSVTFDSHEAMGRAAVWRCGARAGAREANGEVVEVVSSTWLAHLRVPMA